MAKSKGSADYQAAVRYVERSSRERKAAGMKPWTAEQKKFAVCWFLTGVRSVKAKKGKDDGEEETD